ncbi:hypothetical protein WJX81_002708 [Elliptochloris bilobata]|uniref:Pantoate--beta-alanine ligase n=1 Tax=Elliptochloris bilobata TaxID=381761 RepID=A0AAW1RTT9_9CHLO
MGYLHEGHLSLVQEARRRADVVVASIYVNPTQFSATEDFGVYPNSRAEDRRRLEEAGVGATFEPATLYATGRSSGASGDHANVVGMGAPAAGAHETWVEVTRLQTGLCGGSRPHFFRGVATVVAKLFNIVEPDVAVFGRKDYQQWRVLTRMARDLDFAVEVVGLPLVREPDGLAMSSRNALLDSNARKRALSISESLRWAEEACSRGEAPGVQVLRQGVADRISAAGGRVDYVEVVDADELVPVEELDARPVLVAVAAFFGSVRLMDNLELQGS